MYLCSLVGGRDLRTRGVMSRRSNISGQYTALNSHDGLVGVDTPLLDSGPNVLRFVDFGHASLATDEDDP